MQAISGDYIIRRARNGGYAMFEIEFGGEADVISVGTTALDVAKEAWDDPSPGCLVRNIDRMADCIVACGREDDEFGYPKINMIKCLRGAHGVGLKEAKEAIERAIDRKRAGF